MARAVGVVVTLGVILLFLTEVPLLDQLELKTYDMRLKSLPRSTPQHVTIAAIDETSLRKVGRWPWSRAIHAELVRKLDQAGARTIAFDIFFPERESAKADAQFAAAIKASGKVVLGTVFFSSLGARPLIGDFVGASRIVAMLALGLVAVAFALAFRLPRSARGHGAPVPASDNDAVASDDRVLVEA